MTRRLLAVVVVLAGCGGGVASMAPAPEPSGFEGGPWAVEFRLELEPGFWGVGHHRYQIWLECEALGRRRWSQHNFDADTDSEIIEENVYIRLGGVSLHRTGPTGIKLINTDQPTIALVAVLDLERAQAAEAADECAAELRLEDGAIRYLPPGEPFRV